MCQENFEEGFMRLLISIFVMLFSVSLFGSELTIDFKTVKADTLEKKVTIPYGDMDNEVGIYLAKGQDDQSYGVASFLVDKDKIFIVDSVNNVLKSSKLSNIQLAPEMKIRPQTIDILKDSSGIYLYNFYSSELLKIMGTKTVSVLKKKITAPIFRESADIKKTLSAKIDDKVTVTKKSMEKAVVSNAGKKHYFNVKNTRLGSLQFISEDAAGNLHFVVETLESMNPITVKRYWLKTDNSLNLLNITKLPISSIFLPFREIQINSDGSIWFINAASNGLELLYGKGGTK
jgi:hypothetical protein